MTVSQEGVGEHRISARLPWHNVVFRRVERSGTPIPGSEFTMLAIGHGNRDQTWQRTAPWALYSLNMLKIITHAQHTRTVRTQCVEKWREYGQMNCLNWPINSRFAVREPITFKDAFCSVVPWRKWNSRHLRKKFEEIFLFFMQCKNFQCFAAFFLIL